MTAFQGVRVAYPSWESQERIPIDSERVYEFSAWYYATDIGLPPLLFIEIFDSAGKHQGAAATGISSELPPPNQWLHIVFIFNPSAHSKIFPDIAEVKLQLVLAVKYDIAGIPEGSVTTLNYDDVIFRVCPLPLPTCTSGAAH